MELNPEIDLEIDVANLTKEFKDFPVVMYRYSLYRAKIETQRDIAKAKLKEIRAVVRKKVKMDSSIKHTENSIEAEIDTDPSVMEAQMKFIRAEHDASTWAGAVESMRAKKDVLIQLGSDRRKEM
jgi:hypothetical protein